MENEFDFQLPPKKEAKKSRLAEKRFVSPVSDHQVAVILKGVFAKEYHNYVHLTKVPKASNPIVILVVLKYSMHLS